MDQPLYSGTPLLSPAQVLRLVSEAISRDDQYERSTNLGTEQLDGPDDSRMWQDTDFFEEVVQALLRAD